ncbi:RpiR family transcriptional regulator [Cupriavidus taiwanensis]|uniref:RpiR family transcriptional regulator n=1 Tax=Cupriavidus taiwanensis TaxID=164546 RepID=A0A375GZK0_9BURK|nr:MurR/RpiR family transcriptional regulator [Cupriavidus taiwanensis]SOY52622.1 RpiR family transcriptional regulator [Cupriavidus taiwanensis]SOY52790.1 RpiR family transcriptional regulator [Cupriavidus taiwanensis]SOY85645.1 RpiR family transcriptional regulator [Cupriavidus taiwanensis]SOZ60197.1 RpiR family transcriptional regulator [Cupriavidus taiwanensis]SOZ80512.1 RpiR family transcriptional regulator [Cupriavidus taiwanensis]
MQATGKSFVGRIREQLDQLSPSERRLAEFALDFPGDLASYTASELARLANVSNATVTRFVRRMGYASYDEARRQVRSERSAGSPLLLAGTESAAGAGAAAESGSLGAHLRQGLANLGATYRRLSEAQLREIADAILTARKVWIVGFRSSQPLAMYLRWQLLQIVPSAQAVPGAGETMGEHLAGMTEDDVVIVLALRRRVRELPSVVAQAAKACPRLLYITEQGAAASVPARWVLRCDVQAPGVLDNHSAVIGVCHLIVTQVMELAGTPGRRHLGLVEAFHDALDEL